jgi:hypothetical protein
MKDIAAGFISAAVRKSLALSVACQADTADPALPVRWCRPLGGGAEGASGGSLQCMQIEPLALPLPARAGGLHSPHT